VVSVTGMQGERAGEPAGLDVWETCRELIPAGSVFAFLAEHRALHHHLQNRPHPRRPPAAHLARRRPPQRRGPGLARRIPPMAAPVERAIAWLVAHGNRRVPYRGVLKNDNWLHHRAALNLRRLINLGLTHTSEGNWVLA
jgi:hypothetical protein